MNPDPHLDHFLPIITPTQVPAASDSRVHSLLLRHAWYLLR